MLQYSKESMNCWNKLEPTDENVSRLFCFRKESELLPLRIAVNKQIRIYSY